MQVIRFVLALLLCAGAFHPLRSAGQTLVITNGVRTFAGLTNTTIFMSNRCELRVTSVTNPLPGCIIHLNSRDSFFVLQNIEPSSVVASYLSQVRVNGAAAVADNNCRVVVYGGAGSIVIPHAPTFQPLQVFTGPHFTDRSAFLSQCSDCSVRRLRRTRQTRTSQNSSPLARWTRLRPGASNAIRRHLRPILPLAPTCGLVSGSSA